MGLQLVNILRDREEDLARGRSYLPAPDDRPWLDRAERWLKEGVFYAESLRNGRLRFPLSCPLGWGWTRWNCSSGRIGGIRLPGR